MDMKVAEVALATALAIIVFPVCVCLCVSGERDGEIKMEKTNENNEQAHSSIIYFSSSVTIIIYLPVPGGPYNNTPRGGSMPIC